MIFLIIAAFATGIICGMIILWRILPSRLKQHADYKLRWEDAVRLLGTEGNLTQEQVKKITAPIAVHTIHTETFPVLCETCKNKVHAKERPHQPESSYKKMASMAALHSMATWDRRDVEIERAQKLLDPARNQRVRTAVAELQSALADTQDS